jgi:hypothetical protein
VLYIFQRQIARLPLLPGKALRIPWVPDLACIRRCADSGPGPSYPATLAPFRLSGAATTTTGGGGSRRGCSGRGRACARGRMGSSRRGSAVATSSRRRGRGGKGNGVRGSASATILAVEGNDFDGASKAQGGEVEDGIAVSDEIIEGVVQGERATQLLKGRSIRAEVKFGQVVPIGSSIHGESQPDLADGDGLTRGDVAGTDGGPAVATIL